MTELQAALGISQLKKLDNLIKIREKKALYYDKKFKNTDFYVKTNYKNKKSSYHLYIIKCKNKFKKNKIMKYLSVKGIETTTHYTTLHKQPYFLKYRFNNKLLKNAEDYSNRYISIPIYPSLTIKEQKYVIKSIKDGLILLSSSL